MKSSDIKIFIVEDNFLYSFLLEEKLKDFGNFKITAFSSGEECLQMLSNKPNLIISDYNLNGMNGLDLLKKIKSREPRIPVIILSSQKDVQTAADCITAGASDYIEKKNNDESMSKIKDAVLSIFK